MVTRETMYMSTAPRAYSTAITFSVAKRRSATSPTKNGEISDARAVVPNMAPVWVPEKCSVLVRYVLMVTYHAPQTM